MFVSYAQNFEDVILNRLFADRETGTYVDVGASHPVIDSVTHAFYERGWSGLNIEPLPERIAELDYARPRDRNLRIAVAEAAGTATFHAFPKWHGLSTLDPEVAAAMRRWGDEAHPVEVTIRTLSEVLAEEKVGAIDFLKIDVEGAEGRVLAGLDLTRWRPVVILIEATYPTTSEPSHHGWEPALLACGYRFVLFDGLNRFYLREESSEFAGRFSLPPNVFDKYVRWQDAGRPLAHEAHPEHRFARHLADAWLADIGQVDEAALVRLLGSGIPPHAMEKPITAESFADLWRRVFGEDVPAGAAEAVAANDPRPTVAATLKGLVASERFRRKRSRLAGW
ncbi:FkbM family methyltransferase [Prosthecomicrobium sp. N25]|uniref:FkbM family methyltransferase n=1 Tax=Prosthecomicrobium sp. N25 TaxID=3129254 RepID=UPI003077D59F